MHQDRFEFLRLELKELSIDILAEVLSVELINKGIRADEIVFKPVGLRKRPYSRDILGIEFLNEEEKIHISIHRESIYDTLPEAIFHQPLNSKPFKSKDEILDEIKIHRQEEKEARNFFLPIENEFQHLRLLLEQTERKSYDTFSGKAIMQVFYKLFGAVAFLNPEQIATLLILLPRAYELKGNLTLLSQCYSLLIGDDICIKIVKKEKSLETEFIEFEYFLGINTITNSILTVNDEVIKIEVKIKNEERISLYMEDGINSKIINFLNDYFLPFDLNSSIEILIPERKNKEGIGSSLFPSFLGANTYI